MRKLCLLFLSIVALSAADWATFRGNPEQTGIASAKLPEKLELLWKFPIKDGVDGTAAIVGGMIYVGGFDDHLHAISLAEGAEKWKYKCGPIKAAPSVRNGLVYVGDADGMFHCVDAATGTKKWTFDTQAEITSGASFYGDTVLFGSGDEMLYCLKDGKVHWKFRVPGGPVMGTPAIIGDRTFAAGCDSTLHVIDVTNGKEVGMGLDLGGQIGASVAVVGDHLYVGTMSNQLLAIDWKKGAVIWSYDGKQPFYSSAAVTEDLVVLGSRDRRVYAFDRKTGREVWSYVTRGRVDSSPVVVGTRVYIGSQDGSLYVLDLAKGSEIQKIPLGGGIVASPAIVDNYLVIGTTEGQLCCLGARTAN